MTTQNASLAIVSLVGILGFPAFVSDAQAADKDPFDGKIPSMKEYTPLGDYSVTSEPYFAVADAGGPAGGCLDQDHKMGCTRFLSPQDVFMAGGPLIDGLPDGRYFFTVIAPGYQNSGFRDGADGNLSDRDAAATTGDGGAGDFMRNRMFDIKSHEITGYRGSHARGQSADGRPTVALAPFDETANPGGVYVLAVCPVDVVLPAQCRYDSFRIGLTVPPTRAVVSGRNYYDANVNGKLDQGEQTLTEGTVRYWDSIQGTEDVAMDGGFSVVVKPDDLVFSLQPSGRNWMQTANRASQTVSVGEASAAIIEDMSYAVSIGEGSAVDGIQFGSVCLGDGGSRRLGFWASKISEKVLGPDDLKIINALNLRTRDGKAYDPTNIAAFQTWLRTASSADLGTQLSVQLAVAALNVHNGFVDDQALVLMPGANAADELGFGTLDDLMAETDDMLGEEGAMPPKVGEMYVHRMALKKALEEVNQNNSFVQSTPLTCPKPFELPEGAR